VESGDAAREGEGMEERRGIPGEDREVLCECGVVCCSVFQCGMEGGGGYPIKRPQVKLAAAFFLCLHLYTHSHPRTVSTTDTQIYKHTRNSTPTDT